MVDAKYVVVRPHKRKIAFIWAIDYYTHDIVWSNLVLSENYEAYYWMFKGLKKAGYKPKALICDDHQAIQEAFKSVFPRSLIQVCITHYKRNIQKQLNLREQRDSRFMEDIKKLFNSRSSKQFHSKGKVMVREYSDNAVYQRILVDINQRYERLCKYFEYAKCPSTTNLIEGYNKHLSVRIKGLDGFKSYSTAEVWLNAYVMWRRTTPLKCCKGKFKHLNGKITLGETADWSHSKIYSLRS